MFTKYNLKVLREALRYQDGPYTKETELSKEEIEIKKTALIAASNLADKFESILQDFFKWNR